MKALMVVDMQNGQMSKNNQHLIDKINKLIKKNNYDKVIYTRFYNHEESPFVTFLNYKEMLSVEETEICVDMGDDSWIFPKVSYGLAPQQLNYLKEKGVDEVVLCGTDVDACVLAIGYNLFDNGIRPYFKWDCIASKNKDKSAKTRVKAIILRNFGEDSII